MTRRCRVLAGTALLLAPAWAGAHSPIPGIGSFYSGMFHPVLVPASLLGLLALGLLLGQKGLAHSGDAFIALMVATPSGLALSAAAGEPDTDRALLVIAGVLALAVAAALPLPRVAVVAVAAALGLAVGLGASPDGLLGGARWLSLGGSWLGTVLVTSWFAAITELARRDWMKIAARVLASWVAASAVIVLALAWVGPRDAAGTAPRAAPAAQPR